MVNAPRQFGLTINLFGVKPKITNCMVRLELIDFIPAINNTVDVGESAGILQLLPFCAMGLVSRVTQMVIEMGLEARTPSYTAHTNILITQTSCCLLLPKV